MVHGPQFSPSSSPSLSPSLPFSLSSVQHPGLKILRSDSSSSISSRIGWTSLSLMRSLSLSLSSYLFLLDSLFQISSFSSCYFSCYLPSSSFLLLWFVGLALLLCLADCDHLTNVMSPPTVLLFLSPDLPPPAVATHTSSDILTCFLNPFQGSLTLVRTPVSRLCVCLWSVWLWRSHFWPINLTSACVFPMSDIFVCVRLSSFHHEHAVISHCLLCLLVTVTPGYFCCRGIYTSSLCFSVTPSLSLSLHPSAQLSVSIFNHSCPLCVYICVCALFLTAVRFVC